MYRIRLNPLEMTITPEIPVSATSGSLSLPNDLNEADEYIDALHDLYLSQRHPDTNTAILPAIPCLHHFALLTLCSNSEIVKPAQSLFQKVTALDENELHDILFRTGVKAHLAEMSVDWLADLDDDTCFVEACQLVLEKHKVAVRENEQDGDQKSRFYPSEFLQDLLHAELALLLLSSLSAPLDQQTLSLTPSVSLSIPSKAHLLDAMMVALHSAQHMFNLSSVKPHHLHTVTPILKQLWTFILRYYPLFPQHGQVSLEHNFSHPFNLGGGYGKPIDTEMMNAFFDTYLFKSVDTPIFLAKRIQTTMGFHLEGADIVGVRADNIPPKLQIQSLVDQWLGEFGVSEDSERDNECLVRLWALATSGTLVYFNERLPTLKMRRMLTDPTNPNARWFICDIIEQLFMSQLSWDWYFHRAPFFLDLADALWDLVNRPLPDLSQKALKALLRFMTHCETGREDDRRLVERYGHNSDRSNSFHSTSLEARINSTFPGISHSHNSNNPVFSSFPLALAELDELQTLSTVVDFFVESHASSILTFDETLPHDPLRLSESFLNALPSSFAVDLRLVIWFKRIPRFATPQQLTAAWKSMQGTNRRFMPRFQTGRLPAAVGIEFTMLMLVRPERMLLSVNEHNQHRHVWDLIHTNADLIRLVVSPSSPSQMMSLCALLAVRLMEQHPELELWTSQSLNRQKPVSLRITTPIREWGLLSTTMEWVDTLIEEGVEDASETHISECAVSLRLGFGVNSYGCSDHLIESTKLVLQGENGTVIYQQNLASTPHAPNKMSNSDPKLHPFIFRIVNSTASFGSLKFSLESQNSELNGNINKDRPTGARAADHPRCAIVESSTLVLTQIEFQLEMIISPLLITSTDSSTDTSSSVTLVSCVVQTSTPLIPSFTEIMSEQPSSTEAVVTVASASISSLSLLGESGIASTVSLASFPPLITTIVTQSSFFNLTSSQTTHSQPRHRPTQVLAGNEMSRVDDALYGTVASILGHSQSFDIINSTLLECENPRTGRNENDPTIKNITGTHTFTSSAGYFKNEAGFTHYRFTSCIISSASQTQIFTIILIQGLSGAVKLTDCSITIDCKNFNIVVMNIQGVVEGKQSLSIDSCSFKYDRNETLAQTSNQITTYYSVMTDITHSTFESPKGDSRTRTFVASKSVAFIQVNNCQFKDQTTSGHGSVFAYSGAFLVLLLSDSLFEGNKAGANGGSITSHFAHQSFSRCVFRQNEAGTRGGALYFSYPQHIFFEDTHFDSNQAKEKLTTTNDYAHYRGNDIHLTTHNISFFSTVNVIGCMSSTPSNKIGFYYDKSSNANFPEQDKYLPTPITVTLPQLFVEEGKTGEDCVESNPCPLVSTPITKAKSVFTQIHVAVGDYSLSDETITKSIQIVGQGWMVNSTKSTTLKTGGVCVGSNGNLTLTSLSLKPLNASSVLLSHSATTATSLVKDVRIENVKQHTVPLFSFSQGTATLRVCTFNTIALTTSAAVSVSGSASLSLYQVWFMHVSSLSTTGGSCLDAATSASVSIEMSDASRCSSNGPAGAFFITKIGSSTLTLKSLIFTENKASSSLSQIGNDIVLSGFASSFVSINSPISSVSDKPHCLVGGSEVNFQIPNFGYHENGIHHPINTRFYFGLPMSQFKGLPYTINNLVSPGQRVDLRIQNADPIIITDSTFVQRAVDVRHLKIQQDPTSTTSRYILSASTIIWFHSGTLTLPADPQTSPFIVDDADGSILNAKSSSLSFNRVGFVNCSARNGGALLSTCYPDTFRDCRATGTDENGVLVGKGGAIYVKGTSTDARPIRFNSTALNHARFENNTAARGNDIFIESSLFEGKTVDQIPVFGGGSLSGMYRVVIEGRDSEEDKETIHYFLPSPSISVNGSVIEPLKGASGTDDDNCKWTGTHCATMGFGVKHLKQKYENGTHFPLQIRFVWNMTYTEKAIEITDQDITVSGTTTTNAKTAKVLRSLLEVDKDAVEGSFVFTIENKSLLTVTNLDIHPIAKCGMFDLKDDAHSLKLDGVCLICSDSESYRHPLIKSTKNPVTLQNCHFNTTDASIGPAIFEVPLVSFSSTEHAISIKSSSFKSFSVSGHALLTITTEQPISFASVNFEDITQTVTGKARCVHITSSSLDTVVTPSLWTGSFTQSQRLLDFVGCDSSLTSDHPFFESSLLFYLLPPTDNIVAGQTTDNEESEHPNCGTDRLRCSSLSSALASALTHSLSTSIFVSNTTSLSTPLEVTSTASFSSTSDKQTISQSLGGSIVLNGAGQSLSFTSLVFALSPTSTVSTLVTISAGSLSLTTCSIGTDIVTEMNTFMTTLLDVANGCSLSLSGTEFKNLKFTHSSLGTAIVLRLDSSFSSDSGSLFTSVSSNATGSLIFVHSADLETTSKATPFSLIKTTFEPLPARLMTIEEKKRYAGEVGNKGAESLLYFWFPHTESETTLSVDENGEDHRNCGIVQLACQTLETGFASLKATGTTLILNRNDRISTTLTTAFETQTIQSQTTAQTISVSPSGAISISSSRQLSLHTLSFSFESGTRSLPFVKVTTGSLSIEECSFGSSESDTTLTSALFDISGTLRVDSVNFRKLKTSQSAGLFKLELTNTETLCFTTTRIESCSSTGAPLLSLVLSSTTQQTNWDFNLKGISFTEESSNSVPSGALIFISGSSFATQIVPSRFPPIDPETDENKFWGIDSTTSVESSLLVYLVEAGNEIDVDGKKGKDIAHCGHFGVACQTIGKGIGRATAEAASKQINVQDETKMDERITPNSNTLSILGETAQPISVLAGGQFKIENGKLVLSSLSFETSVSSFARSLITLHTAGSLAITSCSFTSFTSSTSPSILLAEVGTSKSVTLSETSFVSCHSTASIRSVISSCLQFVWIKSSDSLADFAGKEGEHPVPVPLFLYFSSLGKKCSSRTVRVMCRIGDTPDKTVTFNTNLEHSAELTFSKAITLAGNEQKMTISETSLSETNSALFTIATNVMIEQLFLQIPSTFQHASLLQCQSGSLEMSNCSLSQEGFESPNEHDFFNSIMSSNQKAGVISAVLTESTTFPFHNNTFTSCPCSGQANAIFLELVNTTTVHADSFDYLMTDLVFDSPSSNADTEIDIDVFVVGNNLDKTMTSMKWENSFSREKGSSLWGEDTATGLNISLLPYLLALEGPVEIDDNGKGFEKCGHFFLFCNSLDLGLRRMKEASVDTMKVMERITTPAPLEPLCDLSIEGNDESSTLSFSLDGCFINSPKDATPSTLSFSSLVIVIPSDSTHQSLFSSLSGTLSFTSCTITGSSPNPLAFSLIDLTAGDLLFSFTLEINCAPINTSDRLFWVDHDDQQQLHIGQSSGWVGMCLEADSSGSILVQHCLFVSCMSNSTTNWIHLLGADANTLNKENWEGTLSTSSLRSSLHQSPTSTLTLLYEFYPRTTPRIVVQKDGKNEDHPLCGSSELPFRTVEITGEGEVKTQMRMDGDFLTIEGHKKGVVKMVGKGQIVNNKFDDPDTLLLSFLTGGQAVVINLTLTDLSFSPTVFDFSLFDLVSLSEVSTTNCSIGKFVKASEGTNFSLKSSSFIGQHKTTTVNDETEEDEAHYVWIVFENVKFSHHRIGAVEMDGGSLRVEASTFHDNAVDNSSFPSVRRNIHCLTGQLTHYSSLSKVETNKKTSQNSCETCWETADSMWAVIGCV
ncbi:hypothetical protein BLNAU_17874 [Blattamonas nauphoetae]|uniref:Uncharacterized protein n=1 Tax=Blattamonas nauphoetae TaxID=2049346 RepID=A0ABQ9X766_9EUKA|nr:hypothetical protein BLNAU_17874 [Blattamonas nauphoetae]